MRRAFLLAILSIVVAGTMPARASSIPVYELGGRPSGILGQGAESLRMPGRPPAGRGDDGLGAAASSMRVNHSQAAGTRTNGRILAVDLARSGYSCSGTALNTPSGSIVITAAHCVIEGGSLPKRMAFVPAYNHGRRPFGTFRVEAAYVMPHWLHGENPDFDVAALKVMPNGEGTLADVVGARGYVTSKSRHAAFEIFGYPAGALRGEELRSCPAEGLGMDSLTNGFFGPPTIPAVCDMAGGSSGGAWLVDGEYVNGVTSYSYASRSTHLFSPYFGRTIAGFLSELP